ncbi:calcium-dependent phosphotriesterase [Rickenella mellea]|uniref:Calcium-dependent phosphotriesterase n=1 Tax=Rickenella mellea TaxID=50990 RepID=A0A4Y7QCS8_9AGAM|nr:calcium-dependent phosphotriesterase [Rickenella mellea]
MRFLWLPVLLAFVAWRNARPLHQIAQYHALKKCDTIKADNLAFCEDAVFWDVRDAKDRLKDRRLILSCDPGRKNWNTVMGPLRNPEPHGALWVIGADRRAKKITLKDYPIGHDFHPLGIDIWHSTPANVTSNLFVVNHGRNRTTIEHFTLHPKDPTNAKWVRTISSRYLISPNAIAMTSPTSFYVSNDHLLTRRLPSIIGHTLPLVESLLGLPGGYVNHVSLHTAPDSTTVVRYTFPLLGIPFANGIAVSPNGKLLAVSSSSMARVHLYNRNASNNDALQPAGDIQVPFAPDNVAWDASGALLIAGHPDFPALTALAKNASMTATAPSWVVRASPTTQKASSNDTKAFDTQAPFSASNRASATPGWLVETMYQSNGTGFSSSSTALRDDRNGKLWITGLYAEGVLQCSP